MTLPKGLVTNRTAADGIAKLLRERRSTGDGATVITLPLPPAACSPNSRCHWAVKARATKMMREAGYAAGVGAVLDFKHPVISATFYNKRKRQHDRDNAIGSLKGGIDGLADAKLFKNDSLVRWGDIWFQVDPDSPRVELRITEGGECAH